ncbi:negative regulator of systemic acquired resistance SNI1 isoform X2 [Typha angustifolia]|uniref:negative regulator of systemic acquired resistance SNI1 isoform X2 n=1 Tax=Typha angustifolia TaxID=59011 RepID=UPI003C2E8917
MDKPQNNNRGFEENTMAILDSSGIKDSRDIHDDRVSFLEAVRSTSLASDSPSAPSWNMYDAIFKILRDGESLELAMASYQILSDLDKYLRVYLTNSGGTDELVIVKEIWSPFILVQESVITSNHLFDTLKFSALIEDMAQAVNSLDVQEGMKAVRNMLLFQYLVNVLEADFIPRHTLYKESLNWVLFRESVLNMILGSRKVNFKSLVRDCMSLVLKRCRHNMRNSLQDLKVVKESGKSTNDSDVSLVNAIPELQRRTCSAVQKLFTLIMGLDDIRKEADLLGATSRIDGFRSPALEIILDELTYNINHVSPFLEVFAEPKWKLEIILQYFSKYCLKHSVRTRRSNDAPKDLTLEGVLNYFSSTMSTKSILKKITSEVVQVLLAHAFQACLSLKHDPDHIHDSTEKIGATLLQICNNIISAFQNLRKIDDLNLLGCPCYMVFEQEGPEFEYSRPLCHQNENLPFNSSPCVGPQTWNLELTSFEKEALFTAAIISSQKLGTEG